MLRLSQLSLERPLLFVVVVGVARLVCGIRQIREGSEEAACMKEEA